MATSHGKKTDKSGDPELSAQEKSMRQKLPQYQHEYLTAQQQRIIDKLPSMNIELPEVEKRDTVVVNESPSVQRIEVISTEVASGIHANKLSRLKVKYDFDDIRIQPFVQTDLTSRYENNQVDPYYHDTEFGKNQLPLMTAPMDTVVNMDNAVVFQKYGINLVLPRTENNRGALRYAFNSFGFNDAEKLHYTDNNPYVLLDIANGHMTKVLKWCHDLKKRNPNVKIMAGNIANPETFKVYANSGLIDYARIGIGNGNGCLTTQQTGVGYPMASLVMECYDKKYALGTQMKIVADGGMKKTADIIIALALGADYVMVGSLFGKALESCGQNYWHGIKINPTIAKYLYNRGYVVQKEFRGMSTKAAQKAMGKTVMKTSEGVVRRYNVEYTLGQWVENFESYLRSTMSYCNANRLGNFIGKIDYNLISQNAFNRFNK